MTPAHERGQFARGTPTSRVWKYKCPAVVIGEWSPSNDNHEAILAFASLLINLF